MEKSIDIIVPAYNEAKNLKRLFWRLSKTLSYQKWEWRVIFIDDDSSDDTQKVINECQKKYPIIYKKRTGRRSRDRAIIDGFSLVEAPLVAVIDADLQYAPEDIVKMYAILTKSASAAVVSRVGNSRINSRHGLLLFWSHLIKHINLRAMTGWILPKRLIYTVNELGLKVSYFDIALDNRMWGKQKSKHLIRVASLVGESLVQKAMPKHVYRIPASSSESMKDAGVVYRKSRYITHSTLATEKSAIVTFTETQKMTILSLLVILGIGVTLNLHLTAIIFIALLSSIYFADVFFNLFLVIRSLHYPPEITFTEDEINEIKNNDLPKYTILCPLYHEAGVFRQFVESISRIDWPKDKLDVILLLEENDKGTIEAAKEALLPDYFRIVIVPESQPKTKPKACNYGLAYAKGEYLVIYDAEDRPDPLQLKKAYLAFKKYGNQISCIQGKLNYYNPHQNVLTRLFTAEYSLWFDIMLPALQSINTTIPLGGTSNHFRTKELINYGGWDPFNVTEDADLGMRLFRDGGKTAIIDSITLEEANSQVKNWIRQRSRWLKGYMQTYFVNMRHPVEFAKSYKQHWFVFQLVAGLRISFMIINPILWLMTLSYFLLYKFVGPQIESIYPAPVFYMAVVSAIFGNFLYLYYYMIGAAKRGQWEVIKYVFFIPLYWVLTSIAALVAFWQLLFKPYYWEKTHHGLITKSEEIKAKKIINFNITLIGVGRFENVKKLVKTGYVSGAFLIGATLGGNILNFLYNTYLGRKLSLADFGLIGLVGSFVYLIQVPLSGLSRTVTHRAAYLLGLNKSPVKSFWSHIRNNAIKFSAIFAVVWFVAIPLLMHVFHSDAILPFLIFIPVWIIGFAGAVDGGFLNGNMLFIIAGLITLIEALGKFIFTVGFVESGHHDLVYLAIPMSMFISFLTSWYFAKRIKQEKTAIAENEIFHFPKRFFATSMLTKLSSIAFLSVDLILAKAFLSPEDAGRYTLISLVGKMIYFIGSLFSQFIIPVVSKHEGEGKNTERSFYKLLIATGLASSFGVVFLGFLSKYTAPILFGKNILDVTQFLPIYTTAILFQTMSASLIMYHQSKHHHSIPVAGFVLSLVQVSAWLVFHNGINDFVNVMFFGGIFYFFVMIVIHLYYSRFRIFVRNIIDFLGLFSSALPGINVQPEAGKARILIFNWRDTKHVWAGGAEVYIQEIAKRLRKNGNTVTIFCGNDGKNQRNEIIDGVNIVRRGGFYMVYVWAFLYYMFRFRGQYDVIVDSENGIPFFTPLYAKEPVVGLIHHVHRDIILNELRLPFYLLPMAFIAKELESILMPKVYRNCTMVTVSESSKQDMIKIGFGNKMPIKVVNPGVSLEMLKPMKKSEDPTLLYLGRLKAYKSIDTLIQSTKTLVKKMPNIKVEIAGSGDARKSLEQLSRKLGLENNIVFLGKVSEEEKSKYLGKAWVFVYPSSMEGWGISVIEANACGTPVVASDVPGLRDSVRNPSTGYLAKYKDSDEFAQRIYDLLSDNDLRKRFGTNARKWAEKFDWNIKAAEFENILLDTK